MLAYKPFVVLYDLLMFFLLVSRADSRSWALRFKGHSVETSGLMFFLARMK